MAGRKEQQAVTANMQQPGGETNDMALGGSSDDFAPLASARESPDDARHELDDNPRYLIRREFRSQFLPDARDISIYLPDAYFTEPERRFPVFYLHDGQNLFDGRTAYAANRTWQAHTTADTLVRERLIQPLILVGVANTGLRRMAEYTPTRDPRLGGGEAPRYAHLLTEELKPLIDHRFRTLADPQNTGLGGSSLGGLVSLAIGLEHSSTFGKLAVMSPSVWWNQRSILDIVNHLRSKLPLTIWLDMGTGEGLRHLRDTDLLHRRLVLRGWRDGIDLQYLRVPGALHNEDAWAARFGQVLRFLFPAR